MSSADAHNTTSFLPDAFEDPAPLSVVDGPDGPMLVPGPTPTEGGGFVLSREARANYNAHTGNATVEHTPNLTAAERGRIVKYYDIEVNAGAHGKVPEGEPDGWELADWLNMPADTEYEVAKGVIDHMIPGVDVLFVEGYGSGGKVDSNTVQTRQAEIDVLRAQAQQTQDVEKMRQADALQADLDQKIQTATSNLEESRVSVERDAFSYAVVYAKLKGIQVVTADYDPFEVERL